MINSPRIFKPGSKFEKDPILYSQPVLDPSFLHTTDIREAKSHKDLFQPYFSRAAVQKLEATIHENLRKFLSRLDEAADLSKTVDLSLGYKCLAADTVMKYCYDRPFGAVDSPDFGFPMIADLEGFMINISTGWYFGTIVNNIARVAQALPRSWIKSVKPLAASFEIHDVSFWRNKDLYLRLIYKP